MPYQVVPESKPLFSKVCCRWGECITVVFFPDVSNDQASVRLEITQILKNAAENPPPRSTKVSGCRVQCNCTAGL